jgi:hypothetical protein
MTGKHSLAAIVQAISQSEIPDQVTDVRILSLHKSKGISASVTIIAGCLEGLPARLVQSLRAVAVSVIPNFDRITCLVERLSRESTI